MSAIIKTLRREVGILVSRPIYLAAMVLVPVAMTFFFICMLGPGLPLKLPAAMVDLDNSQLSRQIARNLNATELVKFSYTARSFDEAMDQVESGKTMGFFVIPRDFERHAIAGDAPTLTFYTNLAYYVPGTLAFKGFKTMAVTTSGKLVSVELVGKGIPPGAAATILQPMTVNNVPLNNPWLSYAYYLAPSFLIGTLGLMIMLMTVFSITQELKKATSPVWLAVAGNRVGTALLGKLLPQTVIFCIVGLFMHSMMFHWNHYPLNGSEPAMLLGLLIFVVACQSFGVIVCAVMPNPRFALSIVSLIGILTFSVAAFSYPVDSMYGAIAVFSYILPVRYYFEIYCDLALNGIPLYFSR
ncbi:MAG: ABC transporter permease, partial [Muribaculaceae bacterium]|nr:ABC transporter permease [Muribaculaceae bacterium]